MNKQFKITVSFEEGFSFHVEAANLVLAEEKAKQIIDEYAHVDIERSTDVHHRDYHVEHIQGVNYDE